MSPHNKSYTLNIFAVNRVLLFIILILNMSFLPIDFHQLGSTAKVDINIC